MHANSYRRMKHFVDHYVAPRASASDMPPHVLDFGSSEPNGNYRPLFAGMNVRYTGTDFAPGPNVDLVLKDVHEWGEIGDSAVDVIVSGQFLEHCQFPWNVMSEVARTLKTGGLACFVVPSRGPIHKAGEETVADAFRFLPDGMLALAEWARLTVIELHWDANEWGDVTVVMRKDPPDSPYRQHATGP